MATKKKTTVPAIDTLQDKIAAAQAASPLPLNAAQIQAITHPLLAKATPDDLRAAGVSNGMVPDMIEALLAARG